MSHNSKKYLIISLIVLYFCTWFMCALIYRGQANKTGGKAFCFNGDILFHLKCEKFKAGLRFPAHTEPEESFSLATKDALSRATFGNMTFIEDFFSRVGNAGAPRDYKEIEGIECKNQISSFKQVFLNEHFIKNYRSSNYNRQKKGNKIERVHIITCQLSKAY